MIGIFDSGSGGLTVLKEIRKRTPQADIVYFGDLKNGLVTATGSFLSTTNLAFPVQTTEIQCWQEFNYCWIADATLSKDNYLSTGLDLQEIQYWTDDYIQTKPSNPGGGCVEENYRLDRKSKTVTYTRRTIDNKTGLCKSVQEEPIIATS